jgi:hypothetical protein
MIIEGGVVFPGLYASQFDDDNNNTARSIFKKTRIFWKDSNSLRYKHGYIARIRKKVEK